MAKTRFHLLFENAIAHAIIDRSQSVVSGACMDYAAYKQQVGYLEGLNDALKIADSLEEKNE